MAGEGCCRCTFAGSAWNSLSLYDLNGAVLGIYNRDHHDGISFFTAAPVVAANSLLLNERLGCPSTRKRSRRFVGRV